MKDLLLTAQRLSKVQQMRHCDLVDGTWHIASAEGEKGNAETLRLPELARTVIASQPRVHGNDFVFVGPHGGFYNSLSGGNQMAAIPGMRRAGFRRCLGMQKQANGPKEQLPRRNATYLSGGYIANR